MTILLLALPLAISFLTGLFIVKMILREEIRRLWLMHFSLAWGVGLGVSSLIGYVNFLVLDRFSATFQITLNLFVMGLAMMATLLLGPKHRPSAGDGRSPFPVRDVVYLVLLLILFAPIYYIASYYPYGGWDSWAVWQFKSRFLFLSDDGWRNMFDPLLWRSSPHYPLLLPLIQVWGWAFVKNPSFYGPMAVSILFTMVSLTLLISSLAPFKKDKAAFLGSCLLISSPFYGRTAFSQYADIPLGYYLLAAAVCLIYAVLKDKKRFALLGGIFVGFLGFSKPEGLVAALGLLGIGSLYAMINSRRQPLKLTVPFWVGSAIALALPATFYLFIAPENMTMINGLASQSDPSTWLRLKTIAAFFLIEVISLTKWKGLWLLLLLLALANAKRSFAAQTILVPAFLASYLCVIGLYYWINTYFDLLWWLSVSLDRIFGSLLPLVLWWVVYAMGPEEKQRPVT